MCILLLPYSEIFQFQKKVSLTEIFADIIWFSENWLNCQIAWQTIHLVDQAFWESYWSPTVQLVIGC